MLALNTPSLANHPKDRLLFALAAKDPDFLVRNKLASQPDLRTMAVYYDGSRIFDEFSPRKIESNNPDRKL